jgi:hypothetical protein
MYSLPHKQKIERDLGIKSRLGVLRRFEWTANGTA